MSLHHKNLLRPRQALEALSLEYPGLWKKIDAARVMHIKDSKSWREFCYLPFLFILNEVNYLYSNNATPFQQNNLMEEGSRICALAAWRVTQGICCFDNEIYEAVRNTPMNGRLPKEVLCRCPEWCMYIKTPTYSL